MTRTKEKVFQNVCLIKVKLSVSFMIWGSMSARRVENLHFVKCIMNDDKYVNVLRNNIIEQMSLNNIKMDVK